jgi:CubicO group peptidase (beta-lactamase class C family)
MKLSPADIANQVAAIVEEATTTRVFPGAQVWLSRGGEVLLKDGFGATTYADTTEPDFAAPVNVATNTIYDIASLSKLFTLTAFLMAARENNISVQERVARFLPSFDTNDKRDITLRQLLNHTSGIGFAIQSFVSWAKMKSAQEMQGDDSPQPQNLSHAELQRAELQAEGAQITPNELWLQQIGEAPLHHAPGTKVLYSCTNYFLLARLIEKWTNQGLEQWLINQLWQPLQMNNTSAQPLKYFDALQIAPTEWRNRFYWRGIVHDEAARQWHPAAPEASLCGNAGIFSTAADLAKFARLWLQEGAWESKQLLHPDDVRQSFSDTVPDNDDGNRRGWCWQLDTQYYMTPHAPPNSAGHTGFTGPTLWLNPQTQQVCIILNNRVHPTRQGPVRMPYHRRIAEVLLSHSA